MKLRLTATVKSNSAIHRAFTTQYGPFSISLKRSRKGELNKVVVEKNIAENDIPRHKQKELPDGRRHHIFENPNDAHRTEIMDMLYYIESLGSFWFGIGHLYLTQTSLEYINSDDEVVFGMGPEKITEGSGRHMFPLTKRNLNDLLEMKPQLEGYIVPLAFYREGRNEFQQLRYIQAFTNFYMFIEGLYANGHAGNHKVTVQLQKSNTLRAAVDDMVAQMKGNNDAVNLFGLKGLMERYKCTNDTDGMIKLLAWSRGDLLHFNIKVPDRHGTPMNQARYRPLAYFAMGVCMKVYAELHSKAIKDMGDK